MITGVTPPAGLNFLCAGDKAFFPHVDPAMRAVSRVLHEGRPPSQIVDFGADTPRRDRPRELRFQANQQSPREIQTLRNRLQHEQEAAHDREEV